MKKNLLQPLFSEAVADYQYLLERNYPKKVVLKMIGDRYLLSGVERTILFRGVTTADNARERHAKIRNDIKDQHLLIDGYNVLITIGSYLNGNLTFISNDGFLRDSSETHGKIIRTGLLERALDLMLNFIQTQKPASIKLFFDAPVSNSKKFSDFVNQKLQTLNINGCSEVVDSPDFVLKNAMEGICCTSDSEIIDSTSLQSFDLARSTLAYNFQPVFFEVIG